MGKRREEYDHYINSDEWAAKRRLAFDHYGRLCSAEGCQRTTKLHVHHKTYMRFGGDELLEDLAILCERHHMELHRPAPQKLRPAQKPRSPKKKRKMSKRARLLRRLDAVKNNPIKKPPPSNAELLKRLAAQQARARASKMSRKR